MPCCNIGNREERVLVEIVCDIQCHCHHHIVYKIGFIEIIIVAIMKVLVGGIL